jgi:TrmH family RNA methyltransferase
MKNMGLSDLALVAPKIYPSAEATARAAGADDILAQAQVFANLDDALADRQRIIGASARLRSIAWPQLSPRECAAKIGAEGGLKSAILFGRESTGLSNDELERCHHLLHIPCNPQFSSLNVAAAVQIVAYELLLAAQTAQPSPVLDEDAAEPANGEEMESFHGHLLRTLHEIGFLHERKSSPMLTRRLRRIFIRSGLEKADIHILRGILAAIQKRSPPCPATIGDD